MTVHTHECATVMREMIREPVQLGATIRNPEDRLVSMLNHLSDDNPLLSTEEALQQVIDGDSPLFRTAVWHIDPQTVLFPFEGLPILRWLGFDGEPPHDHSSTKRWTVEGLRDHPMWEAAMAPYEGDWALYDYARKNCGCSIADLIA